VTLLALVLPAATGLHAGTTGTSGAPFLQIPVMARPAGMAGADTALASGVEGMDYNPAALSDLVNWDLSADYLSYALGISLDELAVGWGRQGYGGGALSLVSLSTPDVAQTDAFGNQTGSTFKEQDLAVAGGYGYALGPWSAGLAVRSVSLSLAGYTESGAEGDLGLGYAFPLGWRLGLALQHLGSLGAASSVADATPMTLRGGLGWKGSLPHGFALALDADVAQPNDSSLEILGGGELNWSLVYLRVGGEWSQDWDSRQTSTLGAGFRLGDVGVDYAFAEITGLGATQRFGVSWRMGAAHAAASAAAEPEAAPGHLAVRRDGDDLVLSWDPLPAAQGYWVFLRRSRAGALERVGKEPIQVNHVRLKRAALLDIGLAVAAAGADGAQGSLSAELHVRAGQALEPLTAPSNLRLADVDGKRKLAWDPAKGGGTVRYQVLVSQSQGSGYAAVGRPLAGTQATIGEASVKKTVYVVVQALRSESGAPDERSAYSNELAVEPR